MPRNLLFASSAGALTVAALTLAVVTPAGAQAPTGWTEVARDSFSRQLAGQWGSPEVGAAYILDPSSTVTLGVSGTEATATIAADKGLTAHLPSISTAEVNITDATRFGVAAGATYDIQHGWKARQQADGSAYTARLRIKADGQASLGTSRQIGSTSTWLTGANLPFTVSAGQQVRAEFQVTGTAPVEVKLRAWLDGTAVPAWQVSHADSSAAAIAAPGGVSLTNFVQTASSAVTFSHDDLSVGALGSTPTQTPTPTVSPTPTPTETTTPPPPLSPSRGAVPLGSAAYAVPAGAIFVANSGADTNSGTQASPLKTVVAAAAKAPAGGVLVLRGGTYHESVATSASKPVTIQNYPGETVWFDGSVPVSNWSKSGVVWVTSGWNTEFSSTMGGDAAFKARFIGTNAMAADPDLVFINGVPLKQVSTASLVTAGTFAVNDAANLITIGSDPTGKEVRASNLAQALNLSGSNSIVQGIGVRRYANGYEVKGAIRLGNTGGTVRNVLIEDVATFGLTLSNSDKVVDHVTIRRAGQLGIGGHQTDRSVVSNSLVSGNNTEKFKDAPVSGGLKFTAARTLRIDNVDASNNFTTGIWCDVSSYQLTIVNNTANGNGKHGIEVEVSDTGIIANNQAINGGEDGIILYDSGHFKVFNNEVGGSSLFGIKLAQDERRQATLGQFPEARDSRYKDVVDPNMTWITQDIQMSNNVFGNGGAFQVYALDGRTNRAVDTWRLKIIGNLFNKRAVKTDPTMVAWGKGDNVTLERYETPALLAAAKLTSAPNAQIGSSKPILDMGPDKTAYASSAVPIPTDVALATGLAAGARLMGVH